ncbi:uncharacterized protein MEPE_04506 [Melanopsichium pennsylvanicum]|uniref:Uncharacterized protein n=1 Tax=Melanopsichium pennsylvanicum TaxID=63383 RepID=A0AAJ4XQ19_9BASI|nr:uncharacterized protein MEPE_04506 [Melanopsichium pennsylvanicum]
MVGVETFAQMLGSPPNCLQIQSLLDQVNDSKISTNSIVPEKKAYLDVLYHNYRTLGLSFQYASKAAPSNLQLSAIDIYSAHGDESWSDCPALPLQIDAIRSPARAEPIKATIAHNSTGKDLVSDLGEPQRKGGGAGGRSGPAAWMEWSFQLRSMASNEAKDTKILIELAGAAARGADRWNAERAGACQWAVITIS